MGEEQDGMEMRPVFQFPIFASDEVSNFMTRTPEPLHKKLKMARMENLIREIGSGGHRSGLWRRYAQRRRFQQGSDRHNHSPGSEGSASTGGRQQVVAHILGRCEPR
ncbi:hypothetical protein [Paracoccus aminovorans]|uniref:hypothetical protein n=1 Tax=Paracoccus aminovorans TaxID=34004 RepID=UPI002B25C6E7|nr:hypothetical protein [Paracoccus aminovorans]